MPLAYVRGEGKAGRIGAQLMAVAAEGDRRRMCLARTPEHEEAADVPVPETVPDTERPEAALGFRVQGYGMTRHADLFTPRQLAALNTFSDLVGKARDHVLALRGASNLGSMSTMCVSLDGYIVGPDGSFDWTPPDQEVFQSHIDEPGVSAST